MWGKAVHVTFWWIYLIGLEITRKNSAYLQVQWIGLRNKGKKFFFFFFSFIRAVWFQKELFREEMEGVCWWGHIVEPEEGFQRGSQIRLWIAHNWDMCPSSNYCIFLRLAGVMWVWGKGGCLTRRKQSFVACHSVFWNQWWGLGWRWGPVSRQLRVTSEHTLLCHLTLPQLVILTTLHYRDL